MKKDKASRRDFLKVTLLGIGAGLLAACKRLVKPVADVLPTLTATPSKTNTPLPTKTNTPSPTPTETNTPSPTPTPTETPCFQLLTPENNKELEPIGKVIFSWEAMPGAVAYELKIIFPSKKNVIFQTSETSRAQYIEAISMGGEFHWQVSAFDTKGTMLCTTETFTFEKPEYIIPTSKPKSKGGGGDQPDDGCFPSGTKILMADNSLRNIEEVVADFKKGIKFKVKSLVVSLLGVDSLRYREGCEQFFNSPNMIGQFCSHCRGAGRPFSQRTILDR